MAPRDSFDDPRPKPVDLSHHLSLVSKRRVASRLKANYKYFFIPGIANLSGGLPNVQYFPFDTLEAQAAKPERWVPTPNYPDGADGAGPSSAGADSTSDRNAASHIAVPKTTDEPDLAKKIDLATALQYGTAQGYPPLLSWIRQFTRLHLHPDVPYRGGPEVLLSCGATDGLSKTLSLFVDPWTQGRDDVRDRPAMLCEHFAYSSALSQARPLGVRIVPVQSDADGMLAAGPGGLEDVLSSWDGSKGRRPHLMYSVTMGHNPTGIVVPVSRRKELYALCSKYDVIIVEDDPYWYLQYPSVPGMEAESRSQPRPAPPEAHHPENPSGYSFLDSLTPSFLAVDTDGRVVRLDTFSKTVAPGCRLGWITAQPKLIERYLRITESSTQQPSGFVQSVVAELVMGPQPPAAKAAFAALRSDRDRIAFSGWKTDGWVRWLAGLRGAYERRVVRMCRVLDEGSVQVRTVARAASQQQQLRPQADGDWAVVEKTSLYDFAWPRGGMFVWLRVHLEKHPLWGAPTRCGDSSGSDDSGCFVDGGALSTALVRFLTREPHLVAVGDGSAYAATDQIDAEKGWAYLRISFAAEPEDQIESCSRRFVSGVHAFWQISDVQELEGLLRDDFAADDADDGLDLADVGSTWLGC